MSLKELRQRKLSVESIVKKMKENDNSYQNADDRIWKLTTDTTGTGYAVIRFLPPVPEEDIPWVRVYSHGFQQPNSRWFIETCPTTVGQDCPVCTANRELWATETELNRKLASKRKRKTSYYSNILVIKDPNAPENEGKVFIYRYGTKIYEKIKDAMDPDPAFDAEAFNPFDVDAGTNFRIKASKVEGYLNYDKSAFDQTFHPLADDDKEIEEIWGRCYPLNPFVAADQIKSFAELELKFKSLSVTGTGSKSSDVKSQEKAISSQVSESNDDENEDNDAESSIDYFKELANDV